MNFADHSNEDARLQSMGQEEHAVVNNERDSTPASTEEQNTQKTTLPSTSTSSADVLSSTNEDSCDDLSTDIDDIRAVLCGAISRYVILYGTPNQSTLANNLMISTQEKSQEIDSRGGEGCNSLPDFHSRLVEIGQIAGDYLWIHAMHHFHELVRPKIVGLRLDDAALEKALDGVKETKPKPRNDAFDCSLDDVLRKKKKNGQGKILERNQDIFDEYDKSFD